MPNQETVVAVFDTQAQAEGAVDALWHAGFPKNHIGMAAPGEKLQQAKTATEDLEERAADGAIAGAVTGGALAPWPALPSYRSFPASVRCWRWACCSA